MSFFRSLLSLPVQAVRSLFTAILSPGRFFRSGQRLFGLSLPARVPDLAARWWKTPLTRAVRDDYRPASALGSTPG